ncbi:hypothetical protein B9Z55_000649 [Caenorhabditis nigoni]|uniref:LysM domain-containing protein n=2 Tax=Caenorhabditis nigoni TaxID=1611254 RepID=A0A2G5VU14_9PELO|nr:hypothetical protein B9Z55_000649 [Caenorhabditis nigoni]
MMTIQSTSSAATATPDYCQPDESTFLVGFNRVRRYGTTQSQSSPATPCTYTIYHVQPDDTLERIALKHNCSVSSLVRANKLWSPSALFMKQFIRIPIFNTQHAPTPPPSLRSQEKQCNQVPASTERVEEEKSMKDILQRIDRNIKTFRKCDNTSSSAYDHI